MNRIDRAELDAVRNHISNIPSIGAMYAPVLVDHCRSLLDEVERLKNDVAMAVQVSGELCASCGWAMKFPGEPCRCELLTKVERLTADPLPAAAWVREVERAAFKRGAEAMREVAAQRCEVSPIHNETTTTGRVYANAVRSLPAPEDE